MVCAPHPRGALLEDGTEKREVVGLVTEYSDS